MNKLALCLLLLGSSVTFAQSSTTQLPSNTSTTSTVEAAPAVNTLSTTAGQINPEAPKKFTGSFAFSAYSMVKDVKERGSGAMIDSENALGLAYAATSKASVALSHRFGLRAVSDSNDLADFNSDNTDSTYKTLDPTVHFNYKMDSVLGSKPYSILTRYYVPVSQESQANESVGILRTQAYITWSLNTRIDASFYGQARLYLNSEENLDTQRGSDSVLRTIVGPVIAYNFNDDVNTYYNPYLDLKSAGYQRGQFNADVANNLNHEVGIWITLAGGNFIVNPAWVTSSSRLGAESYEGAGSDGSTEYDLNLIAYF